MTNLNLSMRRGVCTYYVCSGTSGVNGNYILRMVIGNKDIACVVVLARKSVIEIVE